MNTQEWIAYLLVGAAAGYLVVRYFVRRTAGTCCGEKECPASKEMVRKIEQVKSPKSS